MAEVKHAFSDSTAVGKLHLNRLLSPAQCYKSVVALVEKALGRAAPAQRLNVLYALSAICRRSKAQRGVRDKYGEQCPVQAWKKISPSLVVAPCTRAPSSSHASNVSARVLRLALTADAVG